uniref:IQ motif and ankyrin repeat domain-containing protein 1-like isoform X2 n=1 Tax=Pristiophorus japonicus TaxID=55135 RepID=UPI00398E6288
MSNRKGGKSKAIPVKPTKKSSQAAKKASNAGPYCKTGNICSPKKWNAGVKFDPEHSAIRPDKKLEENAAVTIQCACRQYLARKDRAKRLKEKEDFEELMELLQREAFVALVKREQEAAAREREKEEKERKRRLEEQRRRTRMLEAAFEGDVDEMQAILKEVSQLDSKDGVTLDEKGKVTRLRHQLAMSDCTDAHGNTPLSEAAGGGHPQAIRFLIEKGADPNSKGAYGRTPLYRAAFGGHLAALEMLLQYGADPRIYAEDGIRPAELQKAYCELNKRINEHDKCVQKNLSKTDITLRAVHNAEELLQAKRAATARAQDQLSLAKLELREQLQREVSLNKPKGTLCHIRELDDVLLKDVGNKIQEDGRWPLIIDTSDQASTFLRYRDTNFYDALNPRHMQPEVLRLGLLGAIR